jgi:hypothetical protein
MQDEAPRLIMKTGEASVVFKNRDLYGGNDPSKSAETRAASFLLKPNTVYLLASPLLWYGVSVLVEHLPHSSLLLAVEGDAQLAKIAIEHFPRELKTTGLSLIHPADAGLVFKHIEERGIESFRRVELISLNGAYRFHNKYYARLKLQLEEEIQQFWQNKYTLMHMLPLWVKNIFFNLAERSLDTQKPAISHCPPLTDRAVCVAGAGPCLEAQIPWIRKERHRLFLLVVDTAVEVFYHHGIEVDAVVVQEAQFYNLYDFFAQKNIRSEIWADITGYPGVLRLACGGIRFFTGEFARSKLFSRMKNYGILPPPIPPLGSVGSTAVYLALRASPGPVFVAGLDFAFFPGKTHAKGSPVHTRRLFDSCRLRPIETLPSYPARGIFRVEHNSKLSDCGSIALTTLTLDRYARNFSRFFAGEKRLIRLTPRGLNLNIPETDLEEAGKILTEWEKARFQESAGEDERISAEGSTGGTGENSLSTLPEAAFTLHRVKAFLKNEQALLRSLFRDCRRYLEGNIPAGSKELIDIIEKLNNFEYLFLHFPDTGYSLKKIDPTMVKRILVSTGHFIGVLEKALSRLSPP